MRPHTKMISVTTHNMMAATPRLHEADEAVGANEPNKAIGADQANKAIDADLPNYLGHLGQHDLPPASALGGDN